MVATEVLSLLCKEAGGLRDLLIHRTITEINSKPMKSVINYRFLTGTWEPHATTLNLSGNEFW